ncbi:hypothetical protein ACSBR1_009273 [Camellia fascicularis]
MDDQMDLFPLYCHHTSKTYLSTGWASGVTNVGQFFMGGANEFRTVLSKYVVKCGFQFKYVKNDSIHVTAMCKFAASTGCTWLVHGRVLPSNGIFCLKRFNSLHTYGTAIRTTRNPRIGSDLVADVVADRVRAQPLTRFTDVIFDLKNDYELDISYRLTWLVVEKAMGEVYGDHAVSFDQLRWYSDVVMENNPNSYTNLEFEQGTGRFVRYFISFRVCINGFKHCRSLLFLDGTFLKGRFKGTLLVAITKDGNQGNVCDVLSEVVDRGRELTFVSDRHIGLLQAMPCVFSSAHHAFCLLYLQMNLRDQMKYVNAEHKIGFMRKLRECAYAPTTTSLHNKIEVLKLCSLAIVGEFLKDLQPKHWDVVYFRGWRYGEMSSKAAKGQIIEKRSKRRVKSTNWPSQLCPKMEKKFEAEYKCNRA